MKLALSLVCCIFVFTLPVSAGVRINGIGFDYATIQAAVNAAVNNDILHVSTGLYIENISIITKQITIEGGYFLDYINKTNNPNLTVIDGNSANSTVRMLTNSIVTVEMLTITGGGGFVLGGGVNIGPGSALSTRDARIIENSGFFGGGVGLADGAMLNVLSNTYINSNQAGLGGGICAIGANAAVNFIGPYSDCAGNVAALGGGVAVSGGTYNQYGHTYVYFNQAGLGGGGIYMVDGANGSIQGPEAYVGGPLFFYNVVTNGPGGAVFLASSSLDIVGPGAYIGGSIAFGGSGAGIFMTNSMLTIRNQAQIGFSGAIIGTTDSGGGIYAKNSTVILSNKALIGYCVANTNGGGIYAENSSIYLYDSTVGNTNVLTANHAGSGGGLFTYMCDVALDGSRITKNSAKTAGGAFLFGGRCEFVDSTIAHNTATNIGGLLGQFLTNSIVDHTLIVSNTALAQVGGVYWFNSQMIITNRSMLSYNTGLSYGGMYNMRSPVTLYNSEVSHNKTMYSFGGIFHALAPLTLIDCHVFDNKADLAGTTNGVSGGIFVENGNLTLKAENRNGILTGNSGSAGGGLYLINANLNIETTPPWVYAIEANSATLQGGGIYAEGAVTATISGRVVFEDNTAYNGGGIYANDMCSFSLLPSGGFAPLFVGNHANRTGGGIAIYNDSALTAVNNKFINNTAQTFGGAVHASTGVTLMINSDFGAAPPSDLPHSQFINNRTLAAGSGGALLITANSIADIASTLFVSNSANYRAGAVGTSTSSSRFVNVVAAYNTASNINEGFAFLSSPTELDSCTIAYNGNYGVNSSTFMTELENCIVWGHTVSQVSGTVTAQFCDIQYGFPGHFNSTNDPLFANTSMHDFQLLDGSPCINSGATLVSVTNDCIGTVRPYDGGWDIGAYEFIPEPAGMLLVLALIIGKLSHRKR